MKLHNTATDRIEKAIVLRAPRSRVWRALTNAQEFGAWFGATFEGAFKPGQRIEGRITSPGYEHITIEVTVERMDPEYLMSYRWHPYATDPAVDYSREPTTLVEFHLEDVAGGTQLKVVESGFEGIPLARRAEAFRKNDDGWATQLENIARHVAR
jgi:uncharacterized protein YndB with AHSA1/START domain